jgi:hypothetical protein
MSRPLDKDSVMECQLHGVRRPAFVCQHLKAGSGIGFHVPCDGPQPDWPFKNAWCDACNAVLIEQHYEWNDVSEDHARPAAVCEGCFDDIRQRNLVN